MAIERKYLFVSADFLLDGTSKGEVFVSSTVGFFVKQRVILSSTTQPNLNLEVKRVDESTIHLGPADQPITERSNLTAYKASELAKITAFEQQKNTIKPEDFEQWLYEREPVVAKRVIPVDQWGNTWKLIKDPYGIYRLPVDAQLNVSGVTVDIQNPTTPNIQNIIAITANTEYSYTFPNNTKKFIIKVRDGDAKLRMGFSLNSTNNSYITIPYGAYHQEDSLDLPNGFKVYFQCSKSNKTIEILSWAF